MTSEFMEREFVRRRRRRRRRRIRIYAPALSRAGYCVAMVIGAVTKRCHTDGGANETFFHDVRRWSSNSEDYALSPATMEGRERLGERSPRLSRLSAFVLTAGNFLRRQAFWEIYGRGHSLDRHEQCSPSFSQACYHPEPFGPPRRCYARVREHTRGDYTCICIYISARGVLRIPLPG